MRSVGPGVQLPPPNRTGPSRDWGGQGEPQGKVLQAQPSPRLSLVPARRLRSGGHRPGAPKRYARATQSSEA